MNLIRTILWIALFLASTFCFLVIFESGFGNFEANAKKEVELLKKVFNLGGKKPAETPQQP